jgi:hypothetical protein
LTDQAGLHLLIAASGSKLWRMRYEYSGKEKLLSLGHYPDVSLAAAREQRDDAKRLLRQGRDPSLERKLDLSRRRQAQENNFERVARDWFKRMRPTWTERRAADVLTSLERDVFPQLKSIPITDISPPMVLAVLRAVEANSAVSRVSRAVKDAA